MNLTQTETPLWFLSKTNTRRAWLKLKRKNGKFHNYFPRRPLIERWIQQTGWSEEKVIDEFYRERRLIVKRYRGVDIP
ncbi:hypothetical protein PCC7424_0131 [Gloeothece citriformis PCC 7424]|uniref:Uncharacterized protein n=1 Tax=Gloeothece citriformis (strain PCC 7424) TaxID=65393 RepID=B7K9B8_GLOC7|nr:hypothetical protein [Gloeothece citriformis]ACK68601.1 hypothetical protein PCC7424_0131 [Gloeothece citriformis PCC 7424]